MSTSALILSMFFDFHLLFLAFEFKPRFIFFMVLLDIRFDKGADFRSYYTGGFSRDNNGITHSSCPRCRFVLPFQLCVASNGLCTLCSFEDYFYSTLVYKPPLLLLPLEIVFYPARNTPPELHEILLIILLLFMLLYFIIATHTISSQQVCCNYLIKQQHIDKGVIEA